LSLKVHSTVSPHRADPIPLARKKGVKVELDRLYNVGIISPEL